MTAPPRSRLWLAVVLVGMGAWHLRRASPATAAPAKVAAASKVAPPLGRAAETVHGLDGNVYQVLTGGWWCDKGKQGPYRFVILRGGKAQTEHNLYLQLLASENGQAKERVVKTVPIIETTSAAMYFEDLKLARGERCAAVQLQGSLQRRVGTEDRLEQLELKAFQNGDYLATFEAKVAITPTPAATPTPTRGRRLKLW